MLSRPIAHVAAEMGISRAWGRPGILNPSPRTAVIWPGWLTWTLLPISENHHIEAVYYEIDLHSTSALATA